MARAKKTRRDGDRHRADPKFAEFWHRQSPRLWSEVEALFRDPAHQQRWATIAALLTGSPLLPFDAMPERARMEWAVRELAQMVSVVREHYPELSTYYPPPPQPGQSPDPLIAVLAQYIILNRLGQIPSDWQFAQVTIQPVPGVTYGPGGEVNVLPFASREARRAGRDLLDMMEPPERGPIANQEYYPPNFPQDYRAAYGRALKKKSSTGRRPSKADVAGELLMDVKTMDKYCIRAKESWPPADPVN